MSDALEQIFADMHEALGENLLKKIKEGTATGPELSVARQFLKDNGVDLSSKAGDNLDNLTKAMENDLPDFSDEDNIVNFGS